VSPSIGNNREKLSFSSFLSSGLFSPLCGRSPPRREKNFSELAYIFCDGDRPPIVRRPPCNRRCAAGDFCCTPAVSRPRPPIAFRSCLPPWSSSPKTPRALRVPPATPRPEIRPRAMKRIGRLIDSFPSARRAQAVQIPKSAGRLRKASVSNRDAAYSPKRPRIRLRTAVFRPRMPHGPRRVVCVAL
jgi:hypothetical protein